MNIIQLFEDYNINFVTEGKNWAPGWINTKCPFCNDHSTHLGYDLQQHYFHCWRCGAHPIALTIAKLINVSEQAAKGIIHKYGGYTPKRIITDGAFIRLNLKPHKLPSNTMPLQANHKRYLASRGFDPDYLEREWHLVGTGPVSTLDNIDFKHRIVAPIIWNNQQVSFQTRDITDRHMLRYITCPKDREIIHHKTILYGKQGRWNTTGIIAEGITDVWRLGIYSCCTFGIKFTTRQVQEIARQFNRVAIVFDGGEPQALKQANKLVAELKFRNVDAFRVDITGDPASMSQNDANYLVKQLLIR